MLGKRSEAPADFATSRGRNSSEFAESSTATGDAAFAPARVSWSAARADDSGVHLRCRNRSFWRPSQRFFSSGRTLRVLPVRVGGIDGHLGGRFRTGHIGAFRLTGWFFDFVFIQASGAPGSFSVSSRAASSL